MSNSFLYFKIETIQINQFFSSNHKKSNQRHLNIQIKFVSFFSHLAKIEYIQYKIQDRHTYMLFKMLKLIYLNFIILNHA